MAKLCGLSSCRRFRCQWPRVWPVNGILHCEWSRHSECKWEWHLFVCVFPSAGQIERDKTRNCSSIHNWKRIEGSTRNTFMRLTLIEWLSGLGRGSERGDERSADLLCGGHSCGCCCCCCCVSMETCCHLLLLPRINIKKATTATSTATTITQGGVGLNQVVN